MKIITRDEIEKVLPGLDLLLAIEDGFAAYSAGEAVVPPVGELLLEEGDVHIKYGFLKRDEYYVIKIASGFYDNPKFGLPSSNGSMLLFRKQNGELVSILLDEGRLTDVRTGVAGAIAAKYLAPKNVTRIGIVGAGTQARQQLTQLKAVTGCREVLASGRRRGRAAGLQGRHGEVGLSGGNDAGGGRDSQLLQSCGDLHTRHHTGTLGSTPAARHALHCRGFRHERKAGAGLRDSRPCRPAGGRQHSSVPDER